MNLKNFQNLVKISLLLYYFCDFLDFHVKFLKKEKMESEMENGMETRKKGKYCKKHVTTLLNQ